MTQPLDAGLEESIVGSVLEILESEGYEAVVLREVARRARVSLSTIYKLFPTHEHALSTREELVVRALERWVVNAYPAVTPPAPDEALYDRLLVLIRYIIGPWERSPRMLEALDRARGGPAEHRLTPKIADAVEPIRQAAFAGCDPEFAADVDLILSNLIDALIRKFADGQLQMTDVLAALERAVYRLSVGPDGGRAAPARRTPRRASPGVRDRSVRSSGRG